MRRYPGGTCFSSPVPRGRAFSGTSKSRMRANQRRFSEAWRSEAMEASERPSWKTTTGSSWRRFIWSHQLRSAQESSSRRCGSSPTQVTMACSRASGNCTRLSSLSSQTTPRQGGKHSQKPSSGMQRPRMPMRTERPGREAPTSSGPAPPHFGRGLPASIGTPSSILQGQRAFSTSPATLPGGKKGASCQLQPAPRCQRRLAEAASLPSELKRWASLACTKTASEKSTNASVKAGASKSTAVCREHCTWSSTLFKMSRSCLASKIIGKAWSKSGRERTGGASKGLTGTSKTRGMLAPFSLRPRSRCARRQLPASGETERTSAVSVN
mmetsp:Transcript_31006/g.88886  ORF Transcript_31006/g.88886 Transcript_31006/m.88886 type:complete len:326 (-) Transcript_31006:489-1466(-)